MARPGWLMPGLIWHQLWERKELTKELQPGIFSWRETKERVCVIRCLKSCRLVKWPLGPRTETQLSLQLKSEGAREAEHLWKSSHLASVKGGGNKWESRDLFFKTTPQVLLTGAQDLLPATPVPPALCFGLEQLQLYNIWRKAPKSFLCLLCLLRETIIMRVGRGNVKALLHMCHVTHH